MISRCERERAHISGPASIVQLAGRTQGSLSPPRVLAPRVIGHGLTSLPRRHGPNGLVGWLASVRVALPALLFLPSTCSPPWLETHWVGMPQTSGGTLSLIHINPDRPHMHPPHLQLQSLGNPRSTADPSRPWNRTSIDTRGLICPSFYCVGYLANTRNSWHSSFGGAFGGLFPMHIFQVCPAIFW
ncbi:hypothetical protein BD289DRAFT_39828 [Coniella lustricola]|uniref:Uncharacterized protein n=1 Tax=Coniella lustricola TaxID=2025994 RepID=A0A2T3AJ34_9PEZI|nr:hypothetical protein BD289DRAFT_39828 [Coniella lustricola]